MRVEFQKVTTLIWSLKNRIFIGDLFLIKVSDGLLHPLGSRQRIKLYPTRVFTVTPDFRSKIACMFIAQGLLSYQGFRWVTPTLGSRQRVTLYPARVFTGTQVLRSLYVEFIKITKMSAQNVMFIWVLIKVSAGLLVAIVATEQIYPAIGVYRDMREFLGACMCLEFQK